MKKEKTAKAKAPKLIQSSLGLFSEMDRDVFSSDHDEIMCWTDAHAQEIITKLWPEKKSRTITAKRWEKPVTTTVKRDERLIGFIDLAVTTSGWPERVYFEIKSQVRPGSDIRQINAYKFYQSPQQEWDTDLRGPFVVVSPDDRHADLLEEQGIRFVKYPDFLSV
jgi:hypothetical protein